MNNQIKIKLRFQDEGSEEIYVTHIEEKKYKIEETSIFNPEIQLGSFVELQNIEKNVYEFVKFIEKSNFIMFDWILNRKFIEQPEFEKFKNKIIEIGGTWEQAMTGIFLAHIPKDKEKLFNKELEKIGLKSKQDNFVKRIINKLKQ